MGEIQGKSQTFRDLPVSVGVGEVLCEFHSASAKQIRFCGENKQTNKQYTGANRRLRSVVKSMERSESLFHFPIHNRYNE